ncbi:caspase family protein [Streptomyces sp. NPDC008240]|uniref:caspase family protein n=1 Tax=Streptomyces sp. NPDC008240 TaxID=3364822 RepID=UPI0036EB7D6F
MDLPDPERSRAVLIGVHTYRHLPDLPTVRNNLRRLAELLRDPELWGLPEGHCVVLENPESPRDVLNAVHEAARAAEDAFLVYFAGHGLLAPTQGADLLLALRDSDRQRQFESVNYALLSHEVADTCTADRRVVLLDCCFSGRALKGYMNGPDMVADRTCVNGAYVMTATAENQLALAPPGEEYTAFSGALLRALADGVPDASDPLEMQDLYRHVRKELLAQGRPEPQQRARNDGPDIALARNLHTMRERRRRQEERAREERAREERARSDRLRAAAAREAWPPVPQGAAASMTPHASVTPRAPVTPKAPVAAAATTAPTAGPARAKTRVPAVHRTHWGQYAAVLGVVAFLAVVVWVLALTGPYMPHYRSGDKPGQDNGGCTEYTCDDGVLSWKLPAGGSVTTSFTVDSPGDRHDLGGTMRTSGDCAAIVSWRLKAGTTVLTGGTVKKDTSGQVGRTFPSGDKPLVFTAQRTDDKDCTAQVEWHNPAVT